MLVINNFACALYLMIVFTIIAWPVVTVVTPLFLIWLIWRERGKEEKKKWRSDITSNSDTQAYVQCAQACFFFFIFSMTLVWSKSPLCDVQCRNQLAHNYHCLVKTCPVHLGNWSGAWTTGWTSVRTSFKCMWQCNFSARFPKSHNNNYKKHYVTSAFLLNNNTAQQATVPLALMNTLSLSVIFMASLCYYIACSTGNTPPPPSPSAPGGKIGQELKLRLKHVISIPRLSLSSIQLTLIREN